MDDPEGRAVPDVDHSIPDERAGQYARIDELGRGGQSIVWRAIDVFVGREVALKELVRPELASGSSATPGRDRFLREARLTAQLDHPGIVAILEVARRADGNLLCAQKLVRGETLKVRLEACQSLPERLALVPHVIDACNAVAYAHSRGIVHRDLKPSNIMVGAFGETVVVDWGLAKKRGEGETASTVPSPSLTVDLTATGAVLGTPAYMSPEQARGAIGEIGERSDVYNLGAILYEVLTAQRPYGGATAEQVIADVLRGELRPVREVCPEAPAALAAVAERALRHDPEDRYPSAELLAKELVAFRTGGRVEAYEYGSWELLRKFAGRHRALLIALVLGGAIAVAALVISRMTVARQLQRTRLQLASSFLERGYAAQREGDWSKAAGYFAAARVQHDTHEERWSLAVARARITERILSLEGPAESFVDVHVLPDGRVLALGHSLDHLEVREAASGKVLWERSGEPLLAARFAAPGVVARWRPGAWAFHDASTGRELSIWPDAAGVPCLGRYPIAAAIVDDKLVRLQPDAPPQIIADDAHSNPIARRNCTVSPDGDLVAYQTTVPDFRVVSLVDGHELARAKSDFALALRFSRSHGLIVFRYGRLELIGGPEGPFTIDLPDATFGMRAFSSDSDSGTAVSPDGHVVAIASRRGTTETLVVDLRSRSLRGVLHYAPGAPRLAFSPDGDRVYAAGMGNASLLSGWRLPGQDLPQTPRWWGYGWLSPLGGAALFWQPASGRYEFLKPPEKVVGTGELRFLSLQILGDGPRAGFTALDGKSVFIQDLETDRRIWTKACRECRELSISFDGRVFAFVGDDGLEVWDTEHDRRLFHETRRLRPFRSQCAVSRDGHRVAWNQVDTAVVRDLDSGHEQTVPLDGPMRQLTFGPDPGRLLTVTTRSISVWNVVTGRAVWSRPNDTPARVQNRWSVEHHALILEHGYIANEVLDAWTGERLGWFEGLPRVVTPVEAELYANDLTRKAVVSPGLWDFRAVPPPDTQPPGKSLTSVLKQTGLVLRGVELVAAP